MKRDLEENTLYEILKQLKAEKIIYDEVSVGKVNKIAKFSLVKEASRDLYVFDEVLRESLAKELSRRDSILIYHISWIISFLKDIINLKDIPSVEIDYRKCELRKMLLRRKYFFEANNKLLKEIEKADRLLHLFAEKVYSGIRNGDFINAWLAYVRCVKSSFSLISLLSASKIRKFAKEVKVDPLTGLLSRRYLYPIFKDVLELSFYTETPFSVALIDIDNFKKINDEYGHLVGDCVLKKIAKVIKESLRKSDYIFRYGGEEIVILMPSSGKEESFRILERLRRRIEKEKFNCRGKEVKVTVSVGACTDVYDSKKSPEDYISCADKKLYIAKKTGKNKVVI